MKVNGSKINEMGMVMRYLQMVTFTKGPHLQGKPHGKGVYTWANGEIYDGEWKWVLKMVTEFGEVQGVTLT